MATRRTSLTKPHSRASASDTDLLRSELRAEKLAREATERENRELRSRIEQLEERLEQVLQAQRRQEEFLQAEIRKLQKSVADRDEKLDDANKQLAWFRKQYFDRTSEENIIEESAAEPDEEPDQATHSKRPKRKRGQTPGGDGHGRTDRSDLQRESEVLEIDGCCCDGCGRPYRQISRTESSPLIELLTILVLTDYRRCIYVPDCKCSSATIKTAAPPPKLFPRTMLGNSIWVHLIVQKFLHGIPTNRSLKELSLKGLQLSQGTVTDGLKRISPLFDPLYQAIADHCKGGEYWNADETSWRVFGSGSRVSWLWLIASEDATAFLLDPSRSGAVPQRFFAGSSGALMTDRLSAYKGLHSDIKKAWCWVHVRRDFLKVLNGTKKLSEWATRWLKRIANLFVLTNERFKLWDKRQNYGEVWNQSNANLVTHVHEMQQAWETELAQAGLHKHQKTILLSLKRHWSGLTLFLLDPRVPLHNNRAERLLRNPVVLRKNSYGSGAEWSGQFAAKMFTILQTWLMNGLQPEALLLDFFDQTSAPGRAPPAIELYLPWKMSPERTRHFALPASYKRPG